MTDGSVLLGGAVVGGLGAALAAAGAYVLYVQYAKVRRAETVAGRVTGVGAEPVGGQSDDAHRPSITFEYERDDHAESSDRLTPDGPLVRVSPAYAKPGQHYPDREAAEDATDYEPGESVTVHVDPRTGEAFLEPRPNRAIGLALVVLGAALTATAGWVALGG